MTKITPTSMFVCKIPLYTRYPIVARRAWPVGCAQPLGRVRRASKGILHTKDTFARACTRQPLGQARARR